MNSSTRKTIGYADFADVVLPREFEEAVKNAMDFGFSEDEAREQILENFRNEAVKKGAQVPRDALVAFVEKSALAVFSDEKNTSRQASLELLERILAAQAKASVINDISNNKEVDVSEIMGKLESLLEGKVSTKGNSSQLFPLRLFAQDTLHYFTQWANQALKQVRQLMAASRNVSLGDGRSYSNVIAVMGNEMIARLEEFIMRIGTPGEYKKPLPQTTKELQAIYHLFIPILGLMEEACMTGNFELQDLFDMAEIPACEPVKLEGIPAQIVKNRVKHTVEEHGSRLVLRQIHQLQQQLAQVDIQQEIQSNIAGRIGKIVPLLDSRTESSADLHGQIHDLQNFVEQPSSIEKQMKMDVLVRSYLVTKAVEGKVDYEELRKKYHRLKKLMKG